MPLSMTLLCNWAWHWVHIPGGFPASQDLVRASLCSTTPQNHLCRRDTLFYLCLRKRQHACHCLQKVPDWCSRVQPQAGYSKCSKRKMLPWHFLSICPCFLICAVGRALFQEPASPRDPKGCTSTENKETLLLQSLWCGMKIETSSQRC